MNCEICGYYSDNDSVVHRRTDGIVRCTVCQSKSQFGTFPSTVEEQLDMRETTEWKQHLHELQELERTDNAT